MLHIGHSEPHSVLVRQDSSGIGVLYQYDHWNGAGVIDEPQLDSYADYTDSLVFEAFDSTTNNPIRIKINKVVFKLFEPYLDADDAIITTLDDEELLRVTDELVGNSMTYKAFMSVGGDIHETATWRLKPTISSKGFKIKAGNSSAFKIYELVIEESNEGPLLDPIPDHRSQETIPYVYDVNANDVDGDELSYSLSSAPNGMTINEQTGVIQWFPQLGDANLAGYLITVFVDDGYGGITTLSYQLVVDYAPNTPPEIEPITDLNAQETIAYQYQVVATDMDSDPLSYALTLAPEGMSIDPDTGIIDWLPTVGQHGTAELTLVVTDNPPGGENYAASTVYNTALTVAEQPNHQPIITSDPLVIAQETIAYTYDVEASDSDNDELQYSLLQAPDGMSIHAQTGQIVWLPSDGQAGSYTIAVRVDDGKERENSTNEQTYPLQVAVKPNSAPQADSADYTVSEDGSLGITLVATDQDNDMLSYTIDSLPSHGSLTGAAPHFVYTPDSNYFGSDSFRFHVNDGELDSSLATLNLTVLAQNDAPQFGSTPIISATENALYSYQVSATDADGDALTYSLTSSPAVQGMVLDANSGLVIWTPDYTQAGNHAVSIAVADGQGGEASQQYTITVANTNWPPVVPAQSISTAEDTSVAVSLTATDPDGDSLSYTITGQPNAGTLMGVAPNLTYTPNSNVSGTDSFVYEASDGEASNVATVTITVSAVNDYPTAEEQHLTTVEDTAIAITLSGTDIDGEALSYTVVAQPPNGTLSGTAPNLSYQPNENFNGSDQFAFTVNDGTVDSATAVISISITAQNDAPQFSSTPVTNAVENALYRYHASATDVDGDSLTYSLTVAPLGMSIDSVSGLISWAPDYTQAGDHAISSTVADRQGGETQQSYTLAVANTNQAPTVQDQSVETAEDTSVAITLTATDSDDDALSYIITSQPSTGTLTGVAPNLSYIPNSNANGADSFTFTASDSEALASATVTITVSPANDQSMAEEQSTTTDEDTAIAITLSGTDIDGDVLSYSVVAQPLNGTLFGVAPALSYQPNENFNGADQFEFIVNDGMLDSATAVISIAVTAQNDVPQFSSTPVTIAVENALYSYQASATDVDGDSLTYSLTVAPLGMSIDSISGLISWVPGYTQAGDHAVNVTVSDGQGGETQQSYTLAIDNTNQAPTAQDQSVDTAEDISVAITLTATDSDGDTLNYTITSQPGAGTLTGVAPNLTYAPNSNANGTDSFIFTVSDGKAEDTATVTIVVTPEYDEPPLTTQGKEFWTMFNIRAKNPQYPEDQKRTLYASSTQSGTVHVESIALNIDLSYSLNANEVLTIDLLDYVSEDVQDAKGINPYGIHVTSDVDISLYLLNRAKFSSDATLLLPVVALGRDYYAMSYANDYKFRGDPGYGRANYIGIVATQDNTVIDINPVDTLDDTDLTQELKTEPYQIILNRGESYQAMAQGGHQGYALEVTGSTISANNPIALFTGDKAAGVNENYGDHLVEQIPPIGSWGSAYQTLPLATRYGDTFRILAYKDNTYLWINEAVVARLNSGEFYETVIEEPALIVGSQPILVAQFSNGASFDLGQRPVNTHNADPFMLIVPPVEQFLSVYNVTTPADIYPYNYINLIAPAETIDSIRIDGEQIDANLWITMPDPSYRGVQLPVSFGQHTVTGDRPFGLYAYGFAEYESYGYIGGMALSEDKEITSLALSADYTSAHVGDDVVCIAVQLTGVDSNPVTQNQVSFDRQFSGLSQRHTRLSDATGRAKFCYTAYEEGMETFTVQAQTITETLTINWLPSESPDNHVPKFLSLPDFHATPGEPYNYATIARDPDQDVLAYAVIEGPEGLTIDAATGLVEWVTPPDFLETFVTLEVSDGVLADQQRYRLISTPGANHFPLFTTDPITVAMTGRTYDYRIFASDVDNHPVYDGSENFNLDGLSDDARTYQLLNGPEGMVLTLSHNNNRLVWDVTEADIGEHSVSLQVTDSHGASTTQDFVITVELNQAPEFVSTPDLNAATAHYYMYWYSATDGNGDSIQYSVVSGPQGMTNQNGSYLRWMPTAEQIGDHLVVLQADDQFGGVITQEFTISASANQPPVFTSSPSLDAVIGRNYFYPISTTDAEGDYTSLSLVSGPSGMVVGGRNLSWKPTAQQEGTHSVVVGADDGKGGFSTQSFTLTVSPNFAPQFTSTPGNSVKIGATYQYIMEATDANGDAFSYRKVSGPYGLRVSGNVLTWKIDTYSYVGAHTVVMEAYDIYGAASTQTFELTVVTEDLTIVDFPDNPSIYHDANYSFSIGVINLTGLPIGFVLDQAPAGVSLDENTGLLSWRPIESQVGSHTLTVSVTDNNAQQDSVTFAIQVELNPNPNQPPEINDEKNNFHVKTEELFSHQIDAQDSEGETITFALISAPAGLELSEQGVISWSATEADIGEHSVEIEVSDPYDAKTTHWIDLRVTAPGLWNRRICR